MGAFNAARSACAQRGSPRMGALLCCTLFVCAERGFSTVYGATYNAERLSTLPLFVRVCVCVCVCVHVCVCLRVYACVCMRVLRAYKVSSKLLA